MIIVSDPNNMTSTERQPALQPGPEWASFEQFRVAGSPGLDTIRPGQVARLLTKSGIFRVLHEDDFQSLVGLASEVERLKGGLTTLVHAVKVLREHPTSPSAVELLLHVVTQHASAPVLPARQGHEPAILDEAASGIEDDEFILDAGEVQKQVKT